jgi:Uma2 family endonuclease
MRGRKEFDIDTDPPPDLAIDVEITSSSLDRPSIYATLGVGEVWRFDGDSLRVYQRRGETHEPCERSPALPMLPPEEVLRFLRESDTRDETSLMRSFSLWVREQLLPAWEPGKQGKRGTRRGGKKKPR